jgi:hypothetical protein
VYIKYDHVMVFPRMQLFRCLRPFHYIPVFYLLLCVFHPFASPCFILDYLLLAIFLVCLHFHYSIIWVIIQRYKWLLYWTFYEVTLLNSFTVIIVGLKILLYFLWLQTHGIQTWWVWMAVTSPFALFYFFSLT